MRRGAEAPEGGSTGGSSAPAATSASAGAGETGSSPEPTPAEPAFVPLSEITMEDEEISKADKLRAAERWYTVGGGVANCSSCQYKYDPEVGDDVYPVSAGVAFRDLPQDWGCPICGAGADKFRAEDKMVAGFAENQTYGLGTNSWTEGQKLTIIYGTIALFIFIFLSGYLLG